MMRAIYAIVILGVFVAGSVWGQGVNGEAQWTERTSGMEAIG